MFLKKVNEQIFCDAIESGIFYKFLYNLLTCLITTEIIVISEIMGVQK